MNHYIAVCDHQDLPVGARNVVKSTHDEILIINLDGELLALDNICRCVPFVVGHLRQGEEHDRVTHGGKLARLTDAPIRNGIIYCPRHESGYDVRSGRPVSGGAEIGLNTFLVRIREGQVEVADHNDLQRQFWNRAP